MRIHKRILLILPLCLVLTGTLYGMQEREQKKTDAEEKLTSLLSSLQKKFVTDSSPDAITYNYLVLGADTTDMMQQANNNLGSKKEIRDAALEQVLSNFSYLKGNTPTQLSDRAKFQQRWNRFKNKNSIADPGINQRFYTFTFNDDNTVLTAKESSEPSPISFKELSKFYRLAAAIAKKTSAPSDAIKKAFEYFASLDLEATLKSELPRDNGAELYDKKVILEKQIAQYTREIIELAFKELADTLELFTTRYSAKNYTSALETVPTIQKTWEKIITETIRLYKKSGYRAQQELYKSILKEWQKASAATSRAQAETEDALYWQARMQRFIANLRYDALQAITKAETPLTADSIKNFCDPLYNDLKEKISRPFITAYQQINSAGARQELKKLIPVAQEIAALIWKKQNAKKNNLLLKEVKARQNQFKSNYAAGRMDEKVYLCESFWLDVEAAYRGEQFAQDLATIEKKYMDLIDAKMGAPTEHISPADQETNSLLVKFANTLATIV